MKLEVKNLCVRINKTPILKDVCLSVRDGELLSLLGPSGCGKSTLLKSIAGILPLEAGSIYLGSRDITALSAHKRRVVILFQDMRLFPNMSVAENVAFPARMAGINRAARMQAAEKMLCKVQLAGFGERRIDQLSGGQQQRVALARALSANPDILLLDEPFSSLDETLREDMRALIRTLHRDTGITTILVTHDREEAISMADRIALMSGGQILCCGTPAEVISQADPPEVKQYFNGCFCISGAVKDGLFTGGGVSCPMDAADGEYDMLFQAPVLRKKV